MDKINSNKEAWSRVSEDHYHAFQKEFARGSHELNCYIQKELGDIRGKDVIHLQCNTGADTIALARMGANAVTGVDLVPENIFYAKKLANELGIANAEFVESDIMKLSEVYQKKHDIVFTSEGALGWLPDLAVWAKTVRSLLKEDGFFYVFDSHPFFLSFDEAKLGEEVYEIKYPYFGREPDCDDSIGGYASEPRKGVKAYFWMHPVSEILNSLTEAGLHVEFFHEYPENFFDSGNMEKSAKPGLYQYPYNTDKYPMSFSLKATVYHK